jgi:hypothetical protein
MKRFPSFSLLAVLAMILVTTASWGFLVHRTIHQLAVYQLPEAIQPFFFQNREKLVYDAPRPDQRRNDDSTEATKHFIDFEMYGDHASTTMPHNWDAAVKKYTRDSLLKYGYVPYHVIYMKDKLTAAFKAGNKDSILFYAADLGHYIGDAHVPLHTSVNYDGQLTNQKGLHSLWESTIPELEIESYDLYSAHKATYLKDPTEAIWKAVQSGFTMVPVMLAKETEVSAHFTEAQKYRIQMRRGRETKSYTAEFARAYAAALKPTVNERLRQSAELIADFWYTCWVDAGKPALNGITPGWSEKDKEALQKEMDAYRKNELIKQSLLISRKAQPETN